MREKIPPTISRTQQGTENSVQRSGPSATSVGAIPVATSVAAMVSLQLQKTTTNSSRIQQLGSRQMKHVSSSAGQNMQRKTAEQPPRSDDKGLPRTLKKGIESLSGFSMDKVKVHYNSSQPALVNAHAFAQGTDIYLGPGQEKHLPHEAWHVVQQAQGRVLPTMQMKGNIPVNDDKSLELEADVMGADALGVGTRIMQQKTAVTRESDFRVPQYKTIKTVSSQPLSTVLQALFVNRNDGRLVQRVKEDDEKILVAEIAKEPENWNFDEAKDLWTRTPPASVKRKRDQPAMPATPAPTSATKRARTVAASGVSMSSSDSSARPTSAVLTGPENLEEETKSTAAVAKRGILVLSSSAPGLSLSRPTTIKYEASSAGADKPQWVTDLSIEIGMDTDQEHIGHKIPKAYINGFYNACQDAAWRRDCPSELKQKIAQLPPRDEFAFMNENLQREDGDPRKSKDSKTPEEQLEYHGPSTPRGRFLKPIHTFLGKERDLTYAEIDDILTEIAKVKKIGGVWSDARKKTSRK